MLAFTFIFGVFALQALSVKLDIDENLTVDFATVEGKAVHRIAVGQTDSPTFSPNRLNANIGDQIIFEFHSLNHTLTQSSLGNPCSPIGGLDTGFNQYNPQDREDLTLTITVNSLEPQWFFCKQNQPLSHCHAGMVFALNPGDRMKEFIENAKRGGIGSADSDHHSVSGTQISASRSSVPSISPAASSTASPARTPLAGSSSTPRPTPRPTASPLWNPTVDPIGSPASSQTPDPTEASIITPVQIVTITQTVGCSESASALSVRRSTPETVSVSEGSSASAVSLLALVLTLATAMLCL
ncbi:hypothetical protein CA14_008328 [Aspergillus flavus]|uniref:Extracellular serine-rich protein n=1 Tax=Aspergillus flavus TaxID=5059 RepID=A0AB74CIS1_ASPFL|nr:hypothetical protein CA14_008328 [Aspergillus flavus]